MSDDFYDDEEAILAAIALSLQDNPQVDVPVTKNPPVPVFPNFEADLMRAIELSLRVEVDATTTSAEDDLRRAVGLSLESARRKGITLFDPEEDLKQALQASLVSARRKGVLDLHEDRSEPAPPPEPTAPSTPPVPTESLAVDPPVPTPEVPADSTPAEPAPAEPAPVEPISAEPVSTPAEPAPAEPSQPLSAIPDDQLEKAIEHSLASAAKKMQASSSDIHPHIETQVKKTVQQLIIHSDRLRGTDANQPPETPGRRAIRPGNVASKRNMFQQQ
eukprot:c11996_g1_i3.p1 GENE.c11996_g1_i3~~c11996_g1_i3.p1  ORF type:complete len:289 (+),score=61.26 c11996_g1_i3:43-867(+)